MPVIVLHVMLACHCLYRERERDASMTLSVQGEREWDGSMPLSVQGARERDGSMPLSVQEERAVVACHCLYREREREGL